MSLAPGRGVMARARAAALAITTGSLAAVLLTSGPASGAVPLPDVSLSVALPSVPLPALPSLPVPVPTLPVPTLPPLPTPPPLPLPTPRPLPTLPTLPLPTPTILSPSPTPSGSISDTRPAGSATPSGVGPGALLIDASGNPGTVASTSPGDGSVPLDGDAAPFVDGFIVPGLLIGIPALVLVAILAAQLAVGAAWLPVIRRWRNRRV